MKFKKGDRVRCVDDGGCFGGELTTGKLYTVSAMRMIDGDDYVVVTSCEDWEWFPFRFEPAVVKPKNRSRVDAGPSWGF